MDKNNAYEYPSIHHRLIGYPYRVWIFSILISSLLFVLWNLIAGSPDYLLSKWFIVGYLLTVAIISAFSALPMLLYILVFWALINTKLPAIWIKLLLALTAIVGFSLPTQLLNSFLLGGLFLKEPPNAEFIFPGVIMILSFAFSLKEK